MRYWLYDQTKKKPTGPFSVTQLRGIQGFDLETKVCPEGASTWSPAKSFEDLRAAFGPSPAPEKPTTGQARPASQPSTPSVPATARSQAGGFASRRKRLIAGLVVAAVLAVGASGYWWIRRNSPAGVAARYLSALRARDYRAAYQFLCEASRAFIDLAMFEQYQRLAGAQKWRYSVVLAKEVSPDHVQFKCNEWTTITGSSEVLHSVDLDLVKDRRHWRVAHVASLVERLDEADAKKDYSTVISLSKNLKAITPWDARPDIALAGAHIDRAIVEPPGTFRTKMTREAVEIARDVASRFPKELLAQMNLAIALRNAGLAKEAEEAYGHALRLAESSEMKAKILIGRAKCRSELGEHKGALTDLKEAKSLDPENVEIKQMWTWLGPYMGLIGNQGQ